MANVEMGASIIGTDLCNKVLMWKGDTENCPPLAGSCYFMICGRCKSGFILVTQAMPADSMT